MHTLYISNASPFARVVRVIIREANALIHIHEQQCDPFANNALLRSMNPLGKIPCLQLSNGDTLFDSEVIADFIDAQYSNGSLYTPILENWSLRTFYSLTNGLLDAAVALRIEKRREDRGTQSRFWQQRHNEAIAAALAFTENNLSRLPDSLTALHISIVCAADYLNFRHSERDWLQPHPDLKLWLESTKQRSSFKDTEPS